MSCRAYQQQIQAVADGTATAAERERVDSHVEGCAPCRKELRESRALLGMLTGMPPRQVSDGFEARVLAAVAQTSPARPWAAAWERFCVRFEWRLRRPTAMAAFGLATAVVAAVVVPQYSNYRFQEQVREEVVAVAVERHQALEQSEGDGLDAVDASIALGSGSLITE